MTKEEKLAVVPLWERTTLTVEEASAYTGIGVTKLRQMSDEKGCEFVFWLGNKRMLKRKKLEEFLERAYSV
ncbi:MAG: excisionase family DNA-binding protein [Firmicutes bacterium]|nr:excisionase family DNA-binding protein [Bacillota bacterium]MBR3243933.1 excisionase family DNA-binding protein [Parasporobacterium sp.]